VDQNVPEPAAPRPELPLVLGEEEGVELKSTLLDHVPAAVVGTDLSGSIVAWNRRAEVLFGWSQHEVLGTTLRDLRIGPSDPPTGTEILDRIAAGQTWHGDVPLRRRDGTTIHCEVWNSPVYDADDTLVAVALVAVDLTERRRAADRLAAQYAVTKVLAEARSLQQATPRILRALCDRLGWQLGAIWAMDEATNTLRCVDTWQAGPGMEEFARISQETPLSLGEGLPGRVCQRREPDWVPDVTTDESFPRAAAALRAGLHAGVAFPIMVEGEVLGVIEFFGREIREPDTELLAMMAATGSGIGQFIERIQAERAVTESEARARAMLDSRRRQEAELRARALQQAAVAHLGQRALEGVATAELMQETARLVAETLGTTYCAVHELSPDGQALRLTASAGWEPGQAGPREVPADDRSFLGRALLAADPLDVEDVTADEGPDAIEFRRHGVTSSVATAIRGPGRSLGVLSAHHAERRSFTKDDVHSLQAMANVLAAAMERTRAEDALRRSEERLLLALDAGSMGTWDWDLPTGRLMWSGKLGEIFGLETGAYDGTFAGFVRLIHPEDRDEVVERIWASVESSEQLSAEYRVVRPDGSVRWVATDGQVIRGSTGEAIRMLGVGVDVTDRREVEEERTRLLEL
jgi:PAS domain S-box-containing protein